MERLAQPPARDSMRYMLLALAILFAAQASYVSPWISVFSYAMLAWRWLATDRNWRLPGWLVRSVISLLAFAGVFVTYGTLNGAEAGSALLMVMIALKLTEVRVLRDTMLVLVLAYFLVFAGFVYSQEIPISIWLMVATYALTSTLMIMSRRQDRIDVGQAARRSGRLLLQAVPFAIALFLLFPRLPGPLWGVPSAGGDAVSGLSDRMTPGSITNLVMSDEIAFRVQFDGSPPPPSQRYWRGPVLHLFNGRTWTQGFLQFAEAQHYDRAGPAVSYSVILEPHETQYLFAMPVAAEHPGNTTLTRDFMLASARPVNQRLRYDVTSWLGSRMSPELSGLERRWALQVPDRFNPRSQELAAEWRADATSDRDIVERALRMFRQQEFVYTLQPPPLRGNTVDDFLFNTQRGFCEHYASAFTFLMRAAGVPARVVTGYLGGEFNPVSDDFVVRQSDAHAWSEVWFEDTGWTRVDPTAAVAPSRVELGISGAFADTEELPTHLRRDSTDWAFEFQMRWEAINAAWNEFFLAYGPDAQFALLQLIGMANGNWFDLVLLLVACFTGFGLLLALYLFWINQPPPADPARRELERLRRGLQPQLGEVSAAEGPRDFIARARAELPEQAGPLQEFAENYLAYRYGAAPAARLDELRRLVKRILRQVRVQQG